MSGEVEGVQRGKVTTYDSFKGFGFIRRLKGKDVFFFYDDIADNDKAVNVGDYVEFELKIAGKGPRAYALKKLDSFN